MKIQLHVGTKADLNFNLRHFWPMKSFSTDHAKIVPRKVRRENANSWPGALRQLSCNLANWGILNPFKILITRPYEVILYNIDRMSIAEQFSSVLGISFCYKLVKIVIQS